MPVGPHLGGVHSTLGGAQHLWGGGSTWSWGSPRRGRGSVPLLAPSPDRYRSRAREGAERGVGGIAPPLLPLRHQLPPNPALNPQPPPPPPHRGGGRGTLPPPSSWHPPESDPMGGAHCAPWPLGGGPGCPPTPPPPTHPQLPPPGWEECVGAGGAVQGAAGNVLELFGGGVGWGGHDTHHRPPPPPPVVLGGWAGAVTSLLLRWVLPPPPLPPPAASPCRRCGAVKCPPRAPFGSRWSADAG